MGKIQGSCLCGKLRFSSNADPAMTVVCHCKDCQKQTGSAYSIVTSVPLNSLKISGIPKSYTTHGQSGRVVERKFCGDCGSPIASIAEFAPDLFIIKAGVLDDPNWLTPEFECYTDNRLPCTPATDLPQFSGMPRID